MAYGERRRLPVDFSKAPCIYWPDRVKASYLQRRVLVYSIMYYKLGESCVSDRFYDALSRQLVEMQNAMSKEELEKTKYGYAMKGFDGSTGFDLFSKLNAEDKKHLEQISREVLEQWRMEQ